MPAARHNSDLASAVADAEARFVAANPMSAAHAEKAAAFMPGGNTRTVLHYDPFPLAIAKGDGCRLTDIDGHVYTDFLGEFTAGLYGHSHPVLMTAIRAALADGITLGGPNRYEAQLAELLCARFPSLERVRFCNSGTEANLYAVSTARMYTGRPAILVFRGGYHGGVFYYGEPEPPINAPFPRAAATFNDIEGTLAIVAARASELAAILVEPVQGSAGAIPARHDFLQALRTAADRYGIVLIFDEVMTSRLAPGGMQQHHGVTPDLTTFGKYLGGGLSFGAFGGRFDIMRRYDPAAIDAVPHAGTFNNNVLSMAAGVAGLRDVYTEPEVRRLNGLGEILMSGLNRAFAEADVPMTCTGFGSLLAIHPQAGPITYAEQTWMTGAAATRAAAVRKLLHLDLLASGQYLARRGFLSLSLPMTRGDIDRLIETISEIVRVRRSAFQ